MRLTTTAAAKRNVKGRERKIYRLNAAGTRALRDMKDSIGRAILAAVARRARYGATAASLRRAMARGTSDATLRFYLGKFQREGVLVAKAA